MTIKALVLNLDYTPITVCTVQRAFLLVYLRKADLIEANNVYSFHTVSDTFSMPSVIKLNRYVNMPYKGVVLNRDNVFKRDGFKCQYCGRERELTLDHLIPKAKGGKTSWNNLVTACKKCNSKKGNYSPEEAGLRLSLLPYRPSYIMYLKKLYENSYDEWKPYLNQKESRVA
ncbi:MAG: HNH endonuclease [Cyclobacteriaceae bacterium]|nr:HNH endonuclease [Cyclobacteriaceae bacterium]